MDLLRSWMFVPGHRQKMIDKALGLTEDEEDDPDSDDDEDDE